MATFSIQNFGCRATEADAAALRRELLAHGLELAGEHGSADVVLLNTCTVTAAADSQARETVRKIHRENPSARIVVTGCYAQRAPEEIAAMNGVALVVGNSHQSQIPRLAAALLLPATGAELDRPNVCSSARAEHDFVSVAQLSGEAMSLAAAPAKILTGDIFAQTTVQMAAPDLLAGAIADGRTRPILKIQDGCNNRCAYCVIPLVRGRSRSLPPDDVIAQVRQLHAADAREIVLSGINLGSYGRDLAPRASLAALVRRILDETAIEQVRFSSIEPQDVTEDFVSLIAGSERLAPHFHVPLQSGCDRILRAMHRWYRTEHYAERVSLIHRLLPDAAMGADVIVGFPGETDADFRATCEFIERLPFSYLHVFSFSGRPGTAAEKLPAAVPPAEIRERARALRALSERKAAEFRASQAGRWVRALTLHRQGDDWTEALTGNYLKVRLAGLHPANEWREVRITADPAVAAA
jgi:threonylcarbamoyladenosine tRNA methylthiotransferase MtaB